MTPCLCGLVCSSQFSWSKFKFPNSIINKHVLLGLKQHSIYHKTEMVNPFRSLVRIYVDKFIENSSRIIQFALKRDWFKVTYSKAM